MQTPPPSPSSDNGSSWSSLEKGGVAIVVVVLLGFLVMAGCYLTKPASHQLSVADELASLANSMDEFRLMDPGLAREEKRAQLRERLAAFKKLNTSKIGEANARQTVALWEEELEQ